MVQAPQGLGPALLGGGGAETVELGEAGGRRAALDGGHETAGAGVGRLGVRRGRGEHADDQGERNSQGPTTAQTRHPP